MTSPTCAHVRRVGLCAGVVTGTVSLLVPVAAAQAPSVPEAAGVTEAAGAAGATGVAGQTVPRALAEVEPVDGVRVTPDPAAPGETVLIRADCVPGTHEGTVYSPAFTGTVSLHPATDHTAPRHAEATVKSGVRPGERYVVTANCGGRQSLTSSFTVRPTHSRATRPPTEATADLLRSAVGPRRYEARPESEATAAKQAGSDAKDRRVHTTSDHGPASSGPSARRQQDGVGNAALAMGGGLATVGLAGYLLTLRRDSEQRGKTRWDNGRRAGPSQGRRAPDRTPRGNAAARHSGATRQQRAPTEGQVRER